MFARNSKISKRYKMSDTLKLIRADIAALVAAYAKEQYKLKAFVPG